jgi:hypothetical protein
MPKPNEAWDLETRGESFDSSVASLDMENGRKKPTVSLSATIVFVAVMATISVAILVLFFRSDDTEDFIDVPQPQTQDTLSEEIYKETVFDVPCWLDANDELFDYLKEELSAEFNSQIFLSQPPDPFASPVPSKVYNFEDFMTALKKLQLVGEDFQFWLGDDCRHAQQSSNGRYSASRPG